MATTQRRRGRRPARVDIAAQAVAALEAEVARAPIWAAADELVGRAESEVATATLAADAGLRRQHAAFGREAAAAHRLLTRGLRDRIGSGILADIAFPQRELLHVFGPDAKGTKGPGFYTLVWQLVEGFHGTGSDARADATQGTMSAAHYTVSGWESSYAGVGFQLTPQVAACWLSLRPYVSWDAYAYLNSRFTDPESGVQSWAVAEGLVGVVIQSCKPDGSDFRTDGRTWIPVFKAAERNPNRFHRDDAGSSSTADGLRVDVPATSGRLYTLWIACRAHTFADPNPHVSTMSSGGIGCRVPFAVVEEIPL